jgi:Ras-related protein Rab-8A
LPHTKAINIIISVTQNNSILIFIGVDKVKNMSDLQDLQMKVLMLGDSNVGKSCLVLKFVDERTGPIKSMPTIGIDFKIKRIMLGGRSVRLSIFDTAGQERYRTITASYYRGSQGIVLVYDITERNSFESMRNWLEQIDQCADARVMKVLVANKVDLEDARKVDRSEGEALAREFNMKYFETSAQTGLNVTDVFHGIAWSIQDEILRKQKEVEEGSDSAAAAAPSPTTGTCDVKKLGAAPVAGAQGSKCC